MIKIAYIKQLSDNKWRVYSHKGKNLGTYDSKSAAEERLKQIEMFKHLDKAKINDTINVNTYSSLVRYLRKYKPDIVQRFLQEFKKSFDEAVKNDIENIEQIVLLQTIKNLDLNHELEFYDD